MAKKTTPAKLHPDFAALVKRVRKINPKATDFMADTERELLLCESRDASNLGTWATWATTPQGYDYWYRIDAQLWQPRAPKPKPISVKRPRGHKDMAKWLRQFAEKNPSLDNRTLAKLRKAADMLDGA